MAKTDVRELARKYGLRVAEKPDSQEICFVPDNDYAAVIDARAPGASKPGAVVDSSGRELGRHDGIHRFTIGQRKGLGIAAPAPLYVVRLDAKTHTVVVGTKQDLERREFDAAQVNWIAGVTPPRPIRARVQIRYRHPAAPATVDALRQTAARTSCSTTPQPAITPGQAAVFYDGEEVLGGGWIEARSERVQMKNDRHLLTCSRPAVRHAAMCSFVLRPAFDESFRVERGHAARAGGGDRLAIDVILDVAAREDAGHARLRAVVRHDVAVGVEFELRCEQPGVRRVPDGDEDAFHRQFAPLRPSRRRAARCR